MSLVEHKRLVSIHSTFFLCVKSEIFLRKHLLPFPFEDNHSFSIFQAIFLTYVGFLEWHDPPPPGAKPLLMNSDYEIFIKNILKNRYGSFIFFFLHLLPSANHYYLSIFCSRDIRFMNRKV